MNLLTPTGYKDINDVNIGDELIAYDINTGVIIINTLLKKELWTNDMLPSNPPMYQSVYNEETLEYEEVLMYSGMSSEQVFQETHGDWKFYEINGTWKLYKHQSIWANMKVIHIYDLQIGDIIYDDEDNDVIVTSIVECVEPSWWRLEVSGDHSYISDNLQLHNASRYWQKQNASFNWNATGPTNWGSASGVSDGASVPTSVDDVFFDGVGANGNINSTISATITVLSINISSGYTSTMTHNAILTIQGNVTLSTPYTIAGTSSITVWNGTTITSNGKVWPNTITFSGPTVTPTATINGDLTILGQINIPSGYSCAINQTGTNTLSCNGITNSGFWVLAATCAIRLTGGSLPANGAGGSSSHRFRELIFDGNVTLLGAIHYTGNKIERLSGTITGNVALTIATPPTSITLNTAGIIWSTTFINAANITLTSKFTSNGTLTLPSATTTFSGGSGFETNFLSVPRSVTLENSVEYIVNSGLTGLFIGGGFQLLNSYTISSNNATLRAILTLRNGATCNTIYSFTRIDSSRGRTINTFNGVVTNCVNVRSFTDLQTVSGGFIN